MPNQSEAFKQLLATMPEPHATVAVQLHKLILDNYPQAHESVWPKQNIASYGVCPKKMSEHFVYIANYSTHMNLGFYQGTDMRDPHKLLEGTGTGLRHIKIKPTDQPNLLLLRSYIESSLALRQSR